MRRRRTTPLRLLAAFLALLSLPGWAEVFHEFEPLVHEGHIALGTEHVSPRSSDCALDCRESGCTAFDHHCGCCVSVVAQCPPQVESGFVEPISLPLAPVPLYPGRPSNLALVPPLRPPIA